MSGAIVIRTRGLPDGYEPPSVSLDPPAGSCSHGQAEPVILSTGEIVACVCIACLESLPANWITSQRERAEREARCAHENTAEDRRLVGMFTRWITCADCGTTWTVEV